MTQAAATLETQLKSGELVVWITGSLPFPQEQKEYFLRPSITSYQSIWNTAEHQSTTYVTLVTKPVHILPENASYTVAGKEWLCLSDCPSVHIDGTSVVS